MRQILWGILEILQKNTDRSGSIFLQKCVWVSAVTMLRDLSQYLILIRYAMFDATFKYKCRTSVIFGTLKNGSLQINSLTFNNCFSYKTGPQKHVPKWRQTVSKKAFKKPAFLTKSSKFCMFLYSNKKIRIKIFVL